MRVPTHALKLLSGRVVELRADHLAIFELEQTTGQSLVEWLRSPGETHTSTYQLLYCLAATSRESKPMTFREFLMELPVGEDFVAVNAVGANLILQSLPKAKDTGAGNPQEAVPLELIGAASSSNTPPSSDTQSATSGAPV